MKKFLQLLNINFFYVIFGIGITSLFLSFGLVLGSYRHSFITMNKISIILISGLVVLITSYLGILSESKNNTK
jgi:hypothetical protein